MQAQENNPPDYIVWCIKMFQLKLLAFHLEYFLVYPIAKGIFFQAKWKTIGFICMCKNAPLMWWWLMQNSKAEYSWCPKKADVYLLLDITERVTRLLV